MLIKKELLSVPPAPKPKGKRYSSYIPVAQVVDLPKSGRTLVVDYWEGKNLFARFFCDGKNYSVYRVIKGTWGSGYPIPGSGGYYCPCVERVPETDSVCNDFFQEDGYKCKSGVEEVNYFIYRKASEQRERAKDNLIALMKRHMAMFPAYPENLKDYCQEQVFQKQYIFLSTKDKKGVRTARCSHCGKKFPITETAMSGRETTCPVCHVKAVYRGMWIKSDVVDREDICISYKVDNQLLLRWVHVERAYTWPDFKENYFFDDFAYSLYLEAHGQPRIYTYKYFKSPYAYDAEWHRLPLGSTCDASSYIYTDNLDEVFGERIYNVNLKAGLAGKNLKLQFVQLLNELKNDPKAEYLFKLGLPILATHARAIKGNPDGNGVFQQQVGISKQYLPMLREMNVTQSEVKVIKESGEWVTPELLQRYRNFGAGKIYWLDEVARETGLSKALNYFEKQRTLHPRVSAEKLVTEYRDYLNMSHALRVDMSHKSVRFPADIVEAHQRITERYNAALDEIKMREAEKLNAGFNARANELYAAMELTGFQKDGFCIVLPQKRTDLIAEGQSLNHCVGGDNYAKSHLGGQRMIFFVRRMAEPDKPYFTMQMDVTTWSILQLYGFADCSAPKEVRAFANAFAQFMHNKKARKTA